MYTCIPYRINSRKIKASRAKTIREKKILTSFLHNPNDVHAASCGVQCVRSVAELE